jgi:hypothetical protein
MPVSSWDGCLPQRRGSAFFSGSGPACPSSSIGSGGGLLGSWLWQASESKPGGDERVRHGQKRTLATGKATFGLRERGETGGGVRAWALFGFGGGAGGRGIETRNQSATRRWWRGRPPADGVVLDLSRAEGAHTLVLARPATRISPSPMRPGTHSI